MSVKHDHPYTNLSPKESIMIESNVKAVNNDIKTLVKDAQELLHSAATLTGEKAEDVRKRGMGLLDAALVRGQDAQRHAVDAGKEMAASADVYVKDHPWRVIAVTAGLALLAGALLGRK